MPGTPFHKAEYWEERFTKNGSTFDWLLPPEVLDKPVLEALATLPGPVRIHHIGCGTSTLPLRLRQFVEDPQQIHNTDFSQQAIEIGQKLENDALAQNDNTSEASASALVHPEDKTHVAQSLRTMRWSKLDLLSSDQIVSMGRPYHITIDKSTCDSISCGEDVSIVLPYPLQPAHSQTSFAPLRHGIQAKVHPIHLLALHMAYLTPCGGFWIALSYSDHRFPYWPPYPKSTDEGLLLQEIVDAGFAHPGSLWRLQSHDKLDAPQTERKGDHVVHEPRITHNLYVMVRTDVAIDRVG